MMPTFPRAAALLFSIVLTACGGGRDAPVPAPVQTRVDVLASSARGYASLAYKDGAAYLALSNSTTDAGAVQRAALPLAAGARWTDVALGACGLPRAREGEPVRAPSLRTLGAALWLFQPWYDGSDPGVADEHVLCALDAGTRAFAARDAALNVCAYGFCSKLWMNDLKEDKGILYTNAGAGPNLLASNDRGASWRAVLGQLDAMICTHQAFKVIGNRVLVGGECPLDVAYVRAYTLRADGLGLASTEPLALALPNLENRNVQFIESTPDNRRVFIGVEGGLLRSDDGGRTFRFVIEQPVGGGKNYPYVRAFLAPSARPDTFVVGGFDKATLKPYLAWSADGGANWTDISPLLPGYGRAADDGSAGTVTSVTEDPQGRVLVTVNERDHAKGSLLLLTLGRP